MPEVNQFNGTLMHPGVGIVLVAFVVALFTARVSWILSLLVAGLLILPGMQRIDIASINFGTHRILVIFALIASVTRNSVSPKWQLVDGVMIVWLLSVVLSSMVRSGSQVGLISALTYSGDCAFAYFVARREIKSIQDIDRLSKVVAFSAILVVVPAILEWSLKWNPWSMLGGIRAVPEVREGLVRAQGNSPHPILFGTQWALMFVVIGFSGNQGKPSMLKKIGLLASFALAFMSFSSTSWSVLVVVAMLLPITILRNHLRWILAAFFLSLIPLHFMMNGPVWGLFARVNVFSGSTGWHRFSLIDNAIKNFSEWGLIGTNSTAHWGWGMWDCTNTILLNGLRGGLIGMLAFLLILGIASLRSIRGAEGRSGAIRDQKTAIGWGFCVFFIGGLLAMLSVAFLAGIWILLFIMFAAAVSIQSEKSEVPGSIGGGLKQFGQRSRGSRAWEERVDGRLARGRGLRGDGGENHVTR